MPSRLRLLLSLGAAVIAGTLAAHYTPQGLPEWSRAEFLAEARSGHIRSVEIEDQEVIIGESSTRGPFHTRFRKVEDTALPAELRSLGIEVRFTKSPLGLI